MSALDVLGSPAGAEALLARLVAGLFIGSGLGVVEPIGPKQAPMSADAAGTLNRMVWAMTTRPDDLALATRMASGGK